MCRLRQQGLFISLFASLILFGVIVPPAFTQTVPGTVGGLTPTLPVVPRDAPRPLEGSDVDGQFDPLRDQRPVGEFIHSLKGNDAAVEVIVTQGRLLTTKGDIASPSGTAVVAVGDPTVLDFEVMPNPRMLRLIGLRAGVTDLSITLADGETYTLEVHVVYDLDLLRAQLKQIFPSARLELAQLREHLVVEGQARNAAQVTNIVETLRGYLDSVQVSRRWRVSDVPLDAQPDDGRQPPPQPDEEGNPESGEQPPEGLPGYGPEATGERGRRGGATRASFPKAQIINLIHVPGVQQVLLKVRIAELNRTGIREVGADLLFVDPGSGTILGTQISSAAVAAAAATLGIGGLNGVAGSATGTNSTAFGIFPSGDWSIILRALRQNNLATILAEPNLVTLNGHRAQFLAGGEFPVPVPQSSGLGNTITVVYKEFGVSLEFIPYIVDEDVIRLSVAPEVSNIDPGTSVTIVQGGNPVPGLNTRRTSTTVELRQGQTLAIAGLLQVELQAGTGRIPGLGDMPYLGPFFSNTTHRKIEKELLVMVTPYLVEPMNSANVAHMPGQTIMDPNDKEFYFMNRIEGRTGRPFRPTTDYEVFGRTHMMHYHKSCIQGPVGFSAGPIQPLVPNRSASWPKGNRR